MRGISDEVFYSLVFLTLGVVSTFTGYFVIVLNPPFSELGGPGESRMVFYGAGLLILGIILTAICGVIAVRASRKMRWMRASEKGPRGQL